METCATDSDLSHFAGYPRLAAEEGIRSPRAPPLQNSNVTSIDYFIIYASSR